MRGVAVRAVLHLAVDVLVMMYGNFFADAEYLLISSVSQFFGLHVCLNWNSWPADRLFCMSCVDRRQPFVLQAEHVSLDDGEVAYRGLPA